MNPRDDWTWIVPGLRFGPVTVGERLGLGGMGVVFRGRYAELGIDVALKVLAPGLPRERFQREAAIGMRLRHHPQVAHTYHVDEAHGHPYLIMELLDHTWNDVIEGRRPAGGEDFPRWFLEAARGLAAIHAAGVIHRDIKPSNIMICPRGTSKITDLGLAREQLDGPRTESAHWGTPQYAAPEQLAGAAIDARADIYAFGICCWQMLTGRAMDAWQRKFMSADGPPPLHGRAERRLTPLLRAMTELDPARRPADGAAVTAELLALQRPSRLPTHLAALTVIAVSTLGIGAVLPRSAMPGDGWQTPYRSVFLGGNGLTAGIATDLAAVVQGLGLKQVERPLTLILPEIEAGPAGLTSAQSQVRRGHLTAGQVCIMVQAAAHDDRHVQLRTAVVETGELTDSRFVAIDEVRAQAGEMLRGTLQRLEERGRISARDAGDAVHVSLGRWHGLQAGDRLQVLDARDQVCARGAVLRAFDETALLRLEGTAEVAVGMRVERVPVPEIEGAQ